MADGLLGHLLSKTALAHMPEVEPSEPTVTRRQATLAIGEDVRAELAEASVATDEIVEAVAVQGDAAAALLLPAEGLAALDAEQAGNGAAELAVVVAVQPDHLASTLLADLADMPEQPPGIGVEMAKAEVVEDVAQQDEPAERPLEQEVEQLARSAVRQAQMQIRDDQRVGRPGEGIRRRQRNGRLGKRRLLDRIQRDRPDVLGRAARCGHALSLRSVELEPADTLGKRQRDDRGMTAA